MKKNTPLINSICTLLVAIFLFVPTTPSQSATFIPINDEIFHCKYLMEGIIEKGDADKLKRVMETQKIKTYPAPNNGYPDRLCLNSPGGNLLEAIKMAEIYARNGGTAVRAKERCESACAILFMAGSFIGEEGIFLGVDRIIHPTAKLGFHAPSLEIADGIYERSIVEKAYKIAIAGAAEINRISNEIDIPVTLITDMLNTPSNDMLYVDKVWKAVRWNIAVGPTKAHLSLNKSGFSAACNNVNERSLENNLRNSIGRGSVYTSNERVNWTGGDRLKVTNNGDKIDVLYGSLTYFDDDCYLKLPASMEEIRTVSTTPDKLLVGSGEPDDFTTMPIIFFNGSTNLIDIVPSSNLPKMQTSAISVQTNQFGMMHLPAFDLKGGDIAIKRGIEQDTCIHQCSEQSNCTALTYDSWNNICILKEFNASSRTLLIQPKSHTYVNLENTGRISYSQTIPTFKRRDDRHFPAKAYAVSIKNNRDQCQRICAGEKQCQAYAYSKNLSECELYNLPPEYFPKTGSYIGVKEQLK